MVCRYPLRVSNVIAFPLRRVCALGVPGPVVDEARGRLGNVAISTDAAALQRSDALVIGSDEPGAFDVVRWIRQNLPEFPVLFWTADHGIETFVAHCRLPLDRG